MNTSPIATETPGTDGGGDTSFEQRAAALADELRAERPEPAGERAEDVASETPAGPATPVVAPADSDPEATKRREERRARLAEVAARTREGVDRKERLSAQEKLAREHAAAVARAEKAEALAAARLDVENFDEAALFALAEKKKIDPARLANWIRDSISNPERLAEAAALKATQAAYDPKLAAIEAENAALKARLDAFEATQQSARAAAEEAHHTQVFLGHVKGQAARAPMAVKLLEASSEEFIEIANTAAGLIPDGAGADALLDKIEDLLDSEGRRIYQTYASLYGNPATSRASTPSGAAKPNTVSNSLAGERAAVVEEEDFAKLPLEERARRLSRR